MNILHQRGARTASLVFILSGVFLAALLICACSRSPGDELYTQAQAEVGGGNFPSAITHLDKAIRSNPHLTDAYELKASCYLATGQPGAALTSLSQLRQLNPETPGISTHIAEVYLQVDNVYLLRWAREAVMETPRSPRAHMLLAVGLARSGDGRDAFIQARMAEQLASSRVVTDSVREDQSLAGDPPTLARRLIPLVVQTPYE